MKITLKQTLLAIALAGTFSVANATVFTLSGGNQVTSLGTNPSAADQYIVSHPKSAAGFDDLFLFDLSLAPSNQASAVSLELGSLLDITGGMLSLFKDNGPIGKDGSDTLLGSVAFDFTGGQLNSTLSDGTYYYEITGVANGNPYGGIYDFTANAVPEPETYALMLAGLGVIGFIGRRRLNKFA